MLEEIDEEELLEEEDEENPPTPEMYEHHRIEADSGQNLLRVDKFLHQIPGLAGPGAVLDDRKGAFLQMQGLHIHQEVVHHRIDSEIICHRSQNDMA